MTKAIVLLSGGIDSTVVLAQALAQKQICLTISFDYGQRHHIELQAAAAIAAHYQVPNRLLRIDPTAFGQSALVACPLIVPQNRTTEEMQNGGIPITYVPARNTLFLAYALGQCELFEADEIHFGPNRHDIGLYPDCRPAYLTAFQQLMQQATKQAIEGHAPRLVTPLLNLDKTAIIALGRSLNAPLELCWSCYNPTKNHQPCGRCDACHLRKEGWEAAVLR